jgi:DNA mismatch repair ATPase MutS
LFRGTNAVERIAAGEAVLATLLAPAPAPAPDVSGPPSPHVVLVATHDQELVDLLDGSYAAYHFTDTIDEAGLVFDYQLQPGPSTTRNAIAMLAQRGAPAELVSRALALAQILDRARSTPSSSESDRVVRPLGMGSAFLDSHVRPSGEERSAHSGGAD